jgi:hypothetical protein
MGMGRSDVGWRILDFSLLLDCVKYGSVISVRATTILLLVGGTL